MQKFYDMATALPNFILVFSLIEQMDKLSKEPDSFSFLF